MDSMHHTVPLKSLGSHALCQCYSDIANNFSCFLGDICGGEGSVASDYSECCSIPEAGSYQDPNTGICMPCIGMLQYTLHICVLF